MVQLANIVNVLEGVSPQSLNHFQRLRAVSITASLAPGYTIGDALKMMDDTAKRVLPSDALTDLNGQSREFRDARGGFYLTLALALIFIYLVLSAQFESFADPFVIMLPCRCRWLAHCSLCGSPEAPGTSTARSG